MEKIAENWIWGMIIFPILVTYFKAEIGKSWKSWRIFKTKQFDVGDPCETLNGSTGEFGSIEILEYTYGTSEKKGVKIKYPNGAIETFGLLAWNEIRKRVPGTKDYS
jgi:hypothetical protein